MAQINTSLPKERIDRLKKLAKTERKSLSKLLNELIEIGLKYYENDQELLPPMKQEEYLARIMKLSEVTLKMVYDESKNRELADAGDEAVTVIKQSVREKLSEKYQQDSQ